MDVATPVSSRIVLGYGADDDLHFGFRPGSLAHDETTVDRLIECDGEGHLLTVAPTGKGKGVSSVVPTLLEYPGSVIVFDPKGENAAITARRRREMGQRVVHLNPFGVFGEPTDSLNPLDLLRLRGADVETDAQMLARMLSAENRFGQDPFWDNNACAILSGLIAHFASWGDDPNERTLTRVHERFHSNDVDYDLAVMLDTIGKEMNQFAYREVAAFLQHPADKTRGGVQSTAAGYLKCLTGGGVPGLLGVSSFSLQEFVDGEPTTIYIVIPPHKLDSHRGLLRLLVATLLAAVLTRERRPEVPTLFLLDEAAQLGHFPLLEQAVTLCRGYGLKVWSFWQDLSQLRGNYPRTWQTILNNCDVKQIFGISSMWQAREWASILEHSPANLLGMPVGDQLLVLPDGEECRSRRLNYLGNPRFQGAFDANPRHDDQSQDQRGRPALRRHGGQADPTP